MKLTALQLSGMLGPQLIGPLMIHLTDKDKDGFDLAKWVIDGKGMAAYEFLRDHGPDVIIESFRLSPYWQPQPNGTPGLSSMEPQLRELVEDFCNWPPADEEGDGEPAPMQSGPIDLTSGEPGEGE